MTIKCTFYSVVVLGLCVGCGVPTYDIFEQSQAELATEVGAQCTLDGTPADGEIWLVEQPEACGEYSLCLGVGPGLPQPEGVMCSCRCGGDPNDGPFCACPEGFACEPLADDLVSGPDAHSGSYCVAQ